MRGDVCDDDRLELEEAGELLVDACLRVVVVDQRVGQLDPGAALFGRDGIRSLDCGCGATEVPGGHHVRERVVVDRLVVLVRADDVVDVAPTVSVDPDA